MSHSPSFHIAFRRSLTAVILLSSVVGVSSAQAYDVRTIRDFRTPIAYQLELEPHLVAGTNPPGPGAGSGVGVGVRGSFVILPDGFIRGVNDSVAIGVGIDVGHYYGSWALAGYRDQCLHYESGPAGTQVCTEVTSNGGVYNYLYLPVVMQWNFWLTQRWSVFAEPGLSVYFVGHHGISLAPAAYAGGRFLIANGITLTGRIGYPDIGFGVSFML
jgi:hypothetical protein